MAIYSNGLGGTDKTFAVKYAEQIEKFIVQESKLGMFADNALKAQFIGAQTVKLPKLELVGLGNYTRDTGYPNGNVKLNYQTLTLSQDRGRKLSIDAVDADETGVPELIGNVTREFTRRSVLPEMDAYGFAKIYAKANEKNHVTADASVNTLANLLTCINNVKAALGYSGEEVVAFVNPTMYGALMSDNTLSRYVMSSNFKQGGVDFAVKTIDGVPIIPVDSKRLNTTFIANAGANASTGGWSYSTGAGQTFNASAIVLPRNAASLVKRVDKMNIISPDVNQTMDSWQINYRIHYDLFITDTYENTIYALRNTTSV